LRKGTVESVPFFENDMVSVQAVPISGGDRAVCPYLRKCEGVNSGCPHMFHMFVGETGECVQ